MKVGGEVAQREHRRGQALALIPGFRLRLRRRVTHQLAVRPREIADREDEGGRKVALGYDVGARRGDDEEHVVGGLVEARDERPDHSLVEASRHETAAERVDHALEVLGEVGVVRIDAGPQPAPRAIGGLDRALPKPDEDPERHALGPYKKKAA